VGLWRGWASPRCLSRRVGENEGVKSEEALDRARESKEIERELKDLICKSSQKNQGAVKGGSRGNGHAS
jgi:hypothetical protein